MAAYDIQKQLKGLRVHTGRSKGRRDPFAESFEDDIDDKPRRSRSQTKQTGPPVEKEKPSAPAQVAPAKDSVSSPFAAFDALRDSDDDFLDERKRIDRRPSPAPAKLPLASVTDGARRRGSLDVGLQSQGLNSRIQTNRNPRSAVALAAGSLAYLDDSEEEEDIPQPRRANRYPSPAPRKQSDQADSPHRSSTPRGSREPPKELSQAAAQPSLHTVASPFAGTKYLQDSDSEGEEDSLRRTSTDETAVPAVGAPDKQLLEVQRVDKGKPQSGGGVSWRAFSAGRAEQRYTELEALQTSLRQRGKSISFGTHALTDDGAKVPVQHPEQVASGSRGRRNSRGKSPPRRTEDTKPTEDEMAEGGPVGVYDPTKFKTNPFTGQSNNQALQIAESPSAAQSATPTKIQIPDQAKMETVTAHPALPASLTSASTTSPTSDRDQTSPISPTDNGNLENSTGSLTSKMTVSPPQTIPETTPLDLSASPVMSPSADVTSPLSRDSSLKSSRRSSARPMRVPNAPGTRRTSRRANSGNTSVSPAHAFLSSWTRDASASEPAAEPKPDDEGQAIGLNNEYIIGQTINHGGFGVIKEVHTLNKAGDRIVQAVKIVRKAIPGKDETDNDKVQQELEHEVSVWRHLNHRHVLNLEAVYDTDFATFCVMDLNAGGTLFDKVRKSRASAADNNGRKGLEPKLAKSYAYQLASALRYLHEDIRVCHRDVKLENCLIDMSVPNAEEEGGNLRLCDFGLADFLHSDQSVDGSAPDQFGEPLDDKPPAVQNPTTSSVIGTLEYASPKGLSVNRKLYETAGDVWAFGVIVYALCTGELPFRHAMPSKTVEMILQAEWDEKALINAAAGGMEVKDLVQGCLERDIDCRLTIGEALRSGWFEGCRETAEEESTAIWR